jgi:hypothetical protein
MGSGYQAEQTRIRHQRATPLRIEALLIEIRDLLRGLTEREDRESRMERWMREPWDDAPATDTQEDSATEGEGSS